MPPSCRENETFVHASNFASGKVGASLPPTHRDTHRRGLAVRFAVTGAIGKSVATNEIGGGNITERTVGVDHNAPVSGAANSGKAQHIVIEVGADELARNACCARRNQARGRNRGRRVEDSRLRRGRRAAAVAVARGHFNANNVAFIAVAESGEIERIGVFARDNDAVSAPQRRVEQAATGRVGGSFADSERCISARIGGRNHDRQGGRTRIERHINRDARNSHAAFAIRNFDSRDAGADFRGSARQQTAGRKAQSGRQTASDDAIGKRVAIGIGAPRAVARRAGFSRQRKSLRSAWDSDFLW